MKTKYLLQGICAVVLFAGTNAYGQGKVTAPEHFNHRQGAVITQNIKGKPLSLTVGEWLVLGQNGQWDVDPVTRDTVGFFRCSDNSTPIVGGQFVNPIYLRSTKSDRDDYFIFRSDGTYEFSAGKDGQSSSLSTKYADYRPCLVPVSKGYWKIVPSKNFDGSNNSSINPDTQNHFAKTDDWGVELTDAATGETFVIGYVYVRSNYIRFQTWPKQSQALVSQYTFNFKQADENWKQWLAE